MDLASTLQDNLVPIFTSSISIVIVIQLTTIFLSILAALLLAIAINRRIKNKEDDIIKKHTLSSVLEELTVLQSALNNSEFRSISWDQDQKHFIGNWILMESDSFEASVNSGNFTLLSPNLQNTLSRLYLGIKNNNFLYFQVAKFYSMNIYLSDSVDTVATKITENMNKNIVEIRKGIKDIIPKLETAKKYSRYL
ncbi:MAG: hypothetical protein ACT4N5_06635 [Nitrosopumilaceae archaeon]